MPHRAERERRAIARQSAAAFRDFFFSGRAMQSHDTRYWMLTREGAALLTRDLIHWGHFEPEHVTRIMGFRVEGSDAVTWVEGPAAEW